jgi:hypothetical protein
MLDRNMAYLFFLNIKNQTVIIKGYTKERYLGSFNLIDKTVKIAITIKENKEPKIAGSIDFFIFLFSIKRNISPKINKTPLVREAGFNTNSSINFKILFNILIYI